MDRRTRIISILQQVTKTKMEPASEDSLFDSGLLDSFALPDMLSALEAEFKIKIPDSDLNPRKFDSIERIETYLDNHS